MLTADDRFCPTCGQRTDTHRIKMSHIWHELVHAFMHTDKGIIYLIRELMFRPGHVAREFVEGKRKKYYNPFSFLVIVVAISTFLIANFNLMTMNTRPDPISVFINKHANLVIFMGVPLGSLFTWLFFKRSGKTYAENLVMVAYASGQRSVFYSLICVPLMLSMPEHYMKFVYAYMVIWWFYLAWTCSQFYQQKNAWGFIRGFLAGLFEQLIIFMMIFAAYMIYFRVFHRRGG
ncbi:MAG: DUF3667 domain-containing protein [Chitinophagaceae bacterium]